MRLYKSCITDHFRTRWSNYKGDVWKLESGNMRNEKLCKVNIEKGDHHGFPKDVEFEFDENTWNFVSWSP